MASPRNKSSIIELNDIKALWRVVAKNWYIVLIFLVLSYVISVFYAYRLTNVYAASTQILLKSFDEYNPGSVISDQGSVYKLYVDNSNEKRIIQSRDLIQQTVKKLKLDVSYYIEGRVKVTEVYEGTPFKVEVININPSFYEKEIQLKILSPSQFKLSFVKDDNTFEKTYKFDHEVVEPEFSFIIHQNGTLNERTVKSLSSINYFFQVHSLNMLVNSYLRSITVENPEYTNILQVTMQDVIVERAKQFLDTLSDVYIKNTLKQRIEVNENTVVYIDKQMEDVVGALNSIEDTMQYFRERYNILDLDKEQTEYFNKLSSFDTQKSVLILYLGALNSLEEYIIQNKDPEFLPPDVYVNSEDEFLIRSTSELYSKQILRNQTLNSSTEISSPIKNLDKEIDLLKKNLLTYISNSRVALKSRIADVDNEIAKYVGDIKTIPFKERGLLNIQRKQKVNEDMYLFLLQKRANTIIGRAAIVPLTKIIETSRSIGLIKPNKEKITLYFVGVGLILSLLLVFVRVLFYEKVESVEELKQKTDLPILGEILFNSQIKELLIAVESDPKSPITESFRTIRTNLQYMAADSASKVIIITSNSPGEGKTFCSINLAAILAKAGKKVLLLELDLHKPRIQKGLDMKSDIGISTILINKTGIQECILDTPIENMQVILSGPTPPNASELILSPQMKEIFEYGRQHYDYVITDTPPVGLISDALVMMRLADATLFVINTKFSYRESINNAHEIVAANKFSNFGFILNGVKRKKSKYYYNRYAYGYGYGYGGRYGYGGYSGYGSYGGYGDSGSGTNKK